MASNIPENNVKNDPSGYWRSSVRLILVCLAIWFVASYGLGILIAGPLDSLQIAGFPIGFWFAQQGSIYIFIVLIFVYAWRMNRIDVEHGVRED
jgi:putative solute:sodium symporter small subunit